MANLGTGVQVNTNVVATTEEIKDLQRVIYDISRIANTTYDIDGNIAHFLVPPTFDVAVQDKSAVTGCARNVECIGEEDFQYPLDKMMNDIKSYKGCQVDMLKSNRGVAYIERYVTSWLTNYFNYIVGNLETLPAFVPTTEANVFEIIESMIGTLTGKGFKRSDIVVMLDSSLESEYIKVYGTPVSTQPGMPTANKWGVKDVILGMVGMTSNAYVYVKEHNLFANNCTTEVEAWDGTDEYRGAVLIGGETTYGGAIYDATNSGLKYLAV